MLSNGHKLQAVLVLALLVLVAGCAAVPSYHTDPALATGFVKRIALLPLENHTAERFVEKQVRDLLSTQVMSMGFFEVLEKGDLRRFLNDEIVGEDKTSIPQATARRLGREFGLQAYMAGSVEGYSLERNGSYSYPVVALTLRLVEINSGKILWQASHVSSGYSTKDRLLGLESDNLHQVARQLIEDMLVTLTY
ncbi:MAG: hypothetical protein RBR06_01620 [Desulfuromonadaceae bacterium]|nr:hypothetical protein [Desulfuromonadaceae bacterium]